MSGRRAHGHLLWLIDRHGNQLDPRIEEALAGLVPRFKRTFPWLRDDALLADIFEEAGRKIDARDRHRRIENLHGYAWTAVRNVAASMARSGPGRLEQRTLTAEEGKLALSVVAASRGSAEQIERAIVCRELLAHATPEERDLLELRKMGFSSREIARLRHTSIRAVDTRLSRIRLRLRWACASAESIPRRRHERSP